MADQDINIFDFGDEGGGGGRLDVLLDAIDYWDMDAQSDPVPATDHTTLPSLVAYFNSQVQQHQHQHLPSPSTSISTTAPGLSISSLLAASQQLATPDVTLSPTTQPPWLQGAEGLNLAALNDFGDPYGAMQSMHRILRQTESAKRNSATAAAAGSGSNSALTGGGTKRTWNDANVEDRWDQIRRTMNATTHADSTGWRPPGLTNILCLHSDVAQKSYGTEKRYLSPPPMVRIQGPLASAANSPTFKMSIISHTGETTAHETASLDPSDSKAHFRNLHVTTSAKAKSFSLQLALSHPPPLQPTPDNASSLLSLQAAPDLLQVSDPLPFATFSSSPLSIVSKPSKKTSRARSTTSCILAGSTISLLNRINSQTARTKYMSIESGRLIGRAEPWSAFSINVLRRSEQVLSIAGTSKRGVKLPTTSKAVSEASATLVTYGSEILLTDLLTGTSTDSFVIYKVEQNRILLDAVGPVSQRQKVAFGKKTAEGQPIYLSSAKVGLDGNGRPRVAAAAAAADEDKADDQRPSEKKKMEGDSASEGEKEQGFLTFQAPEAAFAADDGTIRAHQADDYISWTVGGCASFSYSFFNAYDPKKLAGASDFPITPFPTVSSPPEYHPESHSISTSITNFFYQTPATQNESPLEIWLGALGPLKFKILSGRSYGNDLIVETDDIDQEQDQKKDDTCLSISLPTIQEMLDSGKRLSNNSTTSSIPVASTSSAVLPAVTSSSVTLPLIIIRPFDGTAYMTQRTILVEKAEALANGSAPPVLYETSSRRRDWRVGSQQQADSWQVKIL